MEINSVVLITALIFCAAVLYSSVGHAGASGYLAVMALFSLSPIMMKPAALALNILVAIIATVKFYRAGFFKWTLFWPFALTSIPLAFIGGSITLPGSVYKIVVGIILLYAAIRMFATSQRNGVQVTQAMPNGFAMLAGAGIGLLSGLTGVGGGIFLSPLLLMTSWAEPKQASGVTAPFILVNSIAGLLGNLASVAALPAEIIFWAPAAVLGGWIGAEYGSRRLHNPVILKLLSLVLVIAAIKMMFT